MTLATGGLDLSSYEEIESVLIEMLEKWPLYRRCIYSTEVDCCHLPELLNLFCDRCGNEQIWENESPSKAATGFTLTKYRCRNCQKRNKTFFTFWNQGYKHEIEASIVKVGEYPAQQERIEAMLKKRLEEQAPGDLDLYEKALRCRNFNFGIAALAYLRRVVENRMNDLLDLTAELASEYGFEPELVAEIETVKAGRVFSDKVEYAAKILPLHLRPGGNNPMDLLHDLASEGLHSLDEEECIDIFDTGRAAFEYLFRELQVRKDDAELFVDGVKELAKRRSQRQQKRKAKQNEESASEAQNPVSENQQAGE